MLSNKRFYELLYDAASATEADVESIRTICIKCPQFIAAQMLYLKLLHLRGDYHVNKQLKWASVYSPDRDKLYRYVHDEAPIDEARPALDFNPEEIVLPVEKGNVAAKKPEEKTTEKNKN
jgi:hypothetical protein